MIARIRKLLAWPPTTIVMSILAVIILIGSWFEPTTQIQDVLQPQMLLIAVFLAVAIIIAGIFPIHIRHNIKIVLTTIPLYVAAMLLPPALAALVVGIAILLVEIITNSYTRNFVSDIATAISRWVIISFLISWVAQHVAHEHIPLSIMAVGIALLMFVSDLTTATFEIAPMSGEPPWRIITFLLREAGLSEMMQYLLGILAVLAAIQQPWSLVLWIFPLYIVYKTFKHSKEMHEGTSILLESLADAVDLRDPYTGGHSRRVTEYSMQILRSMEMVGPEVELIRSAARVHDIGKIGIPDQILNKAGRLTPEEKQIMDSHPVRGAELLLRHRDFVRGIAIVRHHHERWDGSGYPDGLRGLDIPFGARIVSVADSFDAMTSDRPYRAGITPGQAARILYEGRGEQWDPAIVDAFLRALGQEQLEEASEAVSAPRAVSV
jgi:HD-GYP domain-containing protein (c-di-GMP phosphodiesterase class II)